MTTPETPTPIESLTDQRSLTVTWQDPHIAARAMPDLSGLEFLRAIADGELPAPPIFRLLGVRLVSAEEGRVVFAFTPDERHYNPIGSVHGGVFATLLDSAMGCAIHSALPARVGYTTLELKTNILRALHTTSGEILCEGKVLHVGGRVATSEGRMTDRTGKLIAHGTTTCLVMRPGKEQ